MARLAIILVAVTFPASWGVRLGDEDQKDGASLSTGVASKLHVTNIIDKLANYILGKDPAGLAEKGIFMGGAMRGESEVEGRKLIDCSNPDTGLGFKETVVKCEMHDLLVYQPPPAPDHNKFVTGDHLLKIDKISLHIRCDMGAVTSFVAHQGRTAALGWLGSWGEKQITGYQGPTLCFLETFEMHDIMVNYETGVHKSDTDLTPDIHHVASGERFKTSNVNQLAKLFAPEEDPEEIPEPLNGTELVSWKEAQFRLNTLQAFANGKEINYDRDFNKDLTMLIGSKAEGMMKLYLALGKLVRNIVYDTIKDDIEESATATAGFFSKGAQKFENMFNNAGNDKCCCMKTDKCKKFGWSAGDNTLKFAFEYDDVKYCCKVRDNKCDTDKYKTEYSKLVEWELSNSKQSKVIHQGKRSKAVCPAGLLVDK